MNVKQLRLIALLTLAGVPTLAADGNYNQFLEDNNYHANAVAISAMREKGGFSTLTTALAGVKELIITLETFKAECTNVSVDFRVVQSEIEALQVEEQLIEEKLQDAFTWVKLVPSKPSQKQVAVASGITAATALAGAGVYYRNGIKAVASAFGGKASGLGARAS